MLLILIVMKFATLDSTDAIYRKTNLMIFISILLVYSIPMTCMSLSALWLRRNQFLAVEPDLDSSHRRAGCRDDQRSVVSPIIAPAAPCRQPKYAILSWSFQVWTLACDQMGNVRVWLLEIEEMVKWFCELGSQWDWALISR